MKSLINHKSIFVFFMLLLVGSFVHAKDLPPKPPRGQYVIDNAGFLTTQQAQELNQKINSYLQKTSTSIVVLTEKSLGDESLENYTSRLAQKWGIGQKGKDNGVLIYVAEKEHKIRIEVGYGLEPVIPDILAGRIINNYMQPAFRKGDFYGGLSQAVDLTMKLASKEFTAKDIKKGQSAQQVNGWIFLPILLFFLIFVLIIYLSWRTRVKRIMTTRGVDWATAVMLLTMASRRRSNQSGWGSFSSGGGIFGGGGGGGGFSGFGGGGFGGGGASGGW